MIKLIAIDMDDTLLTDDLHITEGTVAAIQKASKRGVLITLATGRMFASAWSFARELGIQVPLITYNGALIKDAQTNEVLYERLLPPTIARQLVEVAEKNKLHLQVYQDDHLYTASDNELIREYSRMVNVPYHVEANLMKITERGWTKALFIEPSEKLNDLQDELQARFGDQVYVTKTKANYLEVMHPDVSKGKALWHVAQQLHIDGSQIMAIGDSYNDLDMLQVAGIGVAMGNGAEAVKQVADYITYSNNEEGVRHSIEKFILSASVVAE